MNSNSKFRAARVARRQQRTKESKARSKNGKNNEKQRKRNVGSSVLLILRTGVCVYSVRLLSLAFIDEKLAECGGDWIEPLGFQLIFSQESASEPTARSSRRRT